MELAKFDDVGVTFEGIVEAIVNVRQSLVGSRHEVGSPRVTGPARLFERALVTQRNRLLERMRLVRRPFEPACRASEAYVVLDQHTIVKNRQMRG